MLYSLRIKANVFAPSANQKVATHLMYEEFNFRVGDNVVIGRRVSIACLQTNVAAKRVIG